MHLHSQPHRSPPCFRRPIKGFSIITFLVIESVTNTHRSTLQQSRILCVSYMKKLVARKSGNKRRIATLRSECSTWNKNNFKPIPTISQISNTRAYMWGPNRAEGGHVGINLSSSTQIFRLSTFSLVLFCLNFKKL